MGDLKSINILLTVAIVVACVIKNAAGVQTCSENISQFCECFYYPFFAVRCSHKTLKEYPEFGSIQNAIERLDVSYNDLTKFPPRLVNFLALETLDLSYNNIEFVSNDVILPSNLRHLIISYNNISNWINLAPNTFLESATNLESLSLAGNPLGAFNGNDEQLVLVSGSLKKLDLSDCQIHKITGPLMLSVLVNLDHLILKLNPLHTLPDLVAGKLTTLDVSECKLAMMRRTVFSQMPQLSFVNFSGNHRLSLVQKNDNFIESESMRQIDLSNCNMNKVELKGFPNLTTAVLSGNLITELTDDTFQNNVLIEKLDLSSNSISRISAMAFKWLKRLRNIDLSLNMIQQIEDETFAQNLQLGSINLSRNFIDRFRKFTSPNLGFLNMSRCEITQIDADALENLFELIELDLSYNWFSELPDKFGSSFVQILDLSRCRISNIGNDTFSTFPELSRLHLAGNRLTTTFRKEYFANNQYLNEIWLGDNPWRCECNEKSLEFYKYLNNRPPRLKDPSQLRCYSPNNVVGVHWETLCSSEWDQTVRRISTFEKIWTMAMAILIVLAILYSAVYGLRWWNQYHRDASEEQHRQNNLETSRELMRHNRIVLEQQSQLNAPDPRETHPPCYADAVLMPKPQTSLASLKDANFASSESINSLRRAAKRSNSEEHLGAEGSSKSRRLILAARSRKKQIQKLIKITGDSTASNNLADESNQKAETSQRNFEIIDQLETEDGHSPYAKRRPNTDTSEQIQQIHSSIDSLCEPIYANEAAIAEHNHYRSLSTNDNEMPQTSNPLYSSNEASYSSFTSSTSSFDTDDDYFFRPSKFQNQSRSKQQSDV